MCSQTEPKAPLALIVDDDTTVRIVMRSVLESHGIRVNEAEDGEKALQSFEKETPDIIVLDIEMPVKDGLQACAEIRRHPKGKLTPILLSTGHDDIGTLNKAYDAGATDFVIKPLIWPIFGQRIKFILRAANQAKRHRFN